MELRSIASVIGRHRRAATIGTILAVGLAFIAAFRLDFGSLPPLERRQPTTYESTARLFVTQKGFPWGRSALKYASTSGQQTQLEGDPDRFAGLAVLYAQLANSDPLRAGLTKEDKKAVLAKVVPIAQFSSTSLPLIDITGKAHSPERAQALATLVTQRFVKYIRENQVAARIPADNRVVLEVVDPARLGKVASGPSPALPALVLFTLLFVTLGTIFVLDNWRGGRGSNAPRVVEPVPSVVATTTPEDDVPAKEQRVVATVRPGGASTLHVQPEQADGRRWQQVASGGADE